MSTSTFYLFQTVKRIHIYQSFLKPLSVADCRLWFYFLIIFDFISLHWKMVPSIRTIWKYFRLKRVDDAHDAFNVFCRHWKWPTSRHSFRKVGFSMLFIHQSVIDLTEWNFTCTNCLWMWKEYIKNEPQMKCS